MSIILSSRVHTEGFLSIILFIQVDGKILTRNNCVKLLRV